MLSTGLFRKEDVWLSHSGDLIRETVADSFEPRVRDMLQVRVSGGQ